MPWLYRYSIRHPRTTIAIGLACTLAAAPGMWRLKLRTDGHALIPRDAPAIRYDRAIREQFGTRDPIVVLIQAHHPDGIFNVRTLELVRDLTAEFQKMKMEGIREVNVTSLATESSDRVIPGTVKFQNLLDPFPTTAFELKRLRSDLEAIRLYTGTVASRDGNATAIFVGVPDGANRTELAQKIRDRIDARLSRASRSSDGASPETVHVIGAPIAESLLGTQILDDLGVPDRLLGRHATSLTAQQSLVDSRKSKDESGRDIDSSSRFSIFDFRLFIARHIGLVPITLVVMAGVFLISFRTPWAAALPLMEVGCCLIVTFGLIGWFDVPIYLTLAILPVILTVTSVTDEVHVFGRYRREIADCELRIADLEEDPATSAPVLSPQFAIRNADVVSDTMDQMWRPILQTAVTTAVGFLSFAMSPIKPVQAFGLWACIGSLFCMVWSMSVIPAQLVLLGRKKLRIADCELRNGNATPPQHSSQSAIRNPQSAIFERLGRTMLRRRYLALVVAGLLVAVAPLGLRQLRVQDSWIDGFSPNSPFRQATRLFNQQFLGTHILQVCVDAGRPGYSGDLLPPAVDGQFISLPADLVPDPAALIGYQIMLTRLRPIVVTTGPNAGQQLPVNWLSWIIEAERKGDRLVLKTSMNRGLPGPALRLEAGDQMRYRLDANPFKTLAGMQRVAALESFIADQRDAKVGGVIGPAAFLTTTNFMAHARKESFRSIPTDDPEKIDFLWKQYVWIRGEERLRQVVDADFARGLITVYMNDANFLDTGRLLERIRAYEQAELKPHGISLGFAGDVAVSQTLIQAIVSTQVRSLLGSLVGIFLVTALLARSVGWGLYCMLPCCLGVLLNFAVMGWVGMPLGVATSMFAAVTLGIGVDYAIHLLERFQLARGRGLPVEACLVEAVTVTGPPVLIDTLAVSLGFGVMTLSLVPANARLGGLVVLNLITCLAATLLLLPALLGIWQPKPIPVTPPSTPETSPT